MNICKKYVALILVVLFCFAAACPVSAAEKADWETKWDAVTQDGAVLAISPGKDSSEMRFCWLSGLTEKNAFRLGKTSDLNDAIILKVSERLTLTAQKRCTVCAQNLELDTTYYYSYMKNGTWSNIYSFRTDKTDAPFTALFISDVQLGRSGDWKEKEVLLHDVTGWDTALQNALSDHPEATLCLSAGDQAEIGAAEKQYRLFLAPDALRSLPVAPTVGNHEFYFPYLNLHFDLPNRVKSSAIHFLGDEPYYFTKGNALFIVLDTNDIFSFDHESVLEKAVRAYPDTKWRVVLMHHSLYSCEDSETEMPALRKSLSPLMQKYGINLVLSGHTHRYSRSYPIWDGAVSENGVVYLECGCTSGSNPKACPNETPSYAAAGYKASDPSYCVLDFGEDAIEITSYAVVNGDSIRMDGGTVSLYARDDTNAQMSFFAKLLQIALSCFGRAVSLLYA